MEKSISITLGDFIMQPNKLDYSNTYDLISGKSC